MSQPEVPRIPVVEGDPPMRTLMLRVLEENGYEATSARDAREAIATLKTAAFDLLLLDVMLPPVRRCSARAARSAGDSRRGRPARHNTVAATLNLLHAFARRPS